MVRDHPATSMDYQTHRGLMVDNQTRRDGCEIGVVPQTELHVNDTPLSRAWDKQAWRLARDR